MTVSDDQRPRGADPLASQRLELLGKLVAAQMALEKAIAGLAGNGASTSAADAQLSVLAGLQASIGTASATALAAMKGEIASAVAQSKTLADEAREKASAASGAAMTPRDARAAVVSIGHDLFRNHVLDPYLEFSSAEDEKEYRKREHDREEEMARALAMHTPEGDRRAAELVRSQLQDAGAHGANRAPEFADMQEKAEKAVRALDIAAPAQVTKNAPPPSNDVTSIAATLRAAGLGTSLSADGDSGHGLNFDKLAQAERSIERRG